MKLNEKTINQLVSKVESKEVSKSDAIRYLNDKGLERSKIAKILNIKYQFVRNVLITPLSTKKEIIKL